jgi:hypothetical protein
MPKSVSKTEADAIDLADLETSRQSDESTMEALLNETPVVDPNTPPPPDPNMRGPNDPAHELEGGKKPADDKTEDDKKAGKKPDDKPAKTEAEKGAKKPDDKKTPDEEDAELEAEIEQQLKDLPKLPENAPQHAKDAVAAMRKALKAKQKDFKKLTEDDNLTKQERDTLKQQVADLSKKISEIDVEDYKTLKDMRRALAIQDDPEFRNKFVKPIEDRQTDALDILKTKKMPDSILKWIADEGGLMEFYYSNRPVLDDKGKPMMKDGKPVTQSDWFKENVLKSPALTDAERDEIKDAVRDVRKLTREKERALAEARKDGDKWLEKRTEQAKQRHNAAETEVQKAALAEAETLGIYAQILEPKPDATDEQKLAIKKHNERVNKGVDMVKTYISDRSPKGLGRTAVRAAMSHYLLEVNTEMAGRIKELEAALADRDQKLTRFKGAGQTSTKTGSPPANTAPAKTTPPKNESDEQAMERLMEEQTGAAGAKS